MTEIIENGTRLYVCQPFPWVNLDDLVHVLGHVYNHCNVTALSGKARTAPTRKNRRAVAAASCHDLDNIIHVFGDDNPYRYLPIIRGIRCIQCPTACIEAHFASDLRAQFSRQSLGANGLEFRCTCMRCNCTIHLRLYLL